MGLRRIAVDIFLMVSIGAVLGLLAPFGSAAMPPALRFLYWVGFVVAGYCIFRPVSTVARWVTEESRVPRWAAMVLTALVAALPLSALVAFALGGMRVTPVWFGSRFPLLYVQVAALGVGIHLLMQLLFGGERSPPPSEPAPAPPRPAVEASEMPSPFFRRLPPHLGQELLCLEMEDHYVRAVTSLGPSLILMRLGDAVAELGVAGMQVHRSWWVAFAAIEALERDGRATRLRLSNGDTVPVSRAHLPAVREALRAPVRRQV